MTHEEILVKCQQQIDAVSGMEDSACILLLIPGRWGKLNTRRLCSGGPKGKIVEDNFDGRGLRVLFNAQEVKRFVEKILSDQEAATKCHRTREGFERSRRC